MPRINQLPAASSVASTDVVAVDTPNKTYRVPKSSLFNGYYTSAEVDAAIAQSTAFHVGDTFKFDGAQVLFRSLSDKSAMYFSVNLPKAIGSDITSFDITITTSSNTWYTGSTASNLSIGQITSSSTFANKAIGGQRTSIKFSATTTQTPVANAGIGISELNATITFT